MFPKEKTYSYEVTTPAGKKAKLRKITTIYQVVTEGLPENEIFPKYSIFATMVKFVASPFQIRGFKIEKIED
jgi:hypothetical protein